MYRKVAVLGAVAVMAAMVVGCGKDTPTDSGGTSDSYTLSVSAVPAAGGVVSVDPKQDKYDKGKAVSVVASANDGYIFRNWAGASDAKDSLIVVTMDANKELVAHFSTLCSLKVVSSLDTGGSVSVNPNKTVFLSGDTVFVTATVKAGHKFMGWSGPLTSKNLTDTLVVTKSETLTANFEPLAKFTLEVTVNDPLGGSVELLPAGGIYTEGDTVTVTATANTGYGFKRWGGANTARTPIVKLVMTNSMSMIANFLKIYDLTVETIPLAGNPGEIVFSPIDGPYLDGDTVTLRAVANSGFLFNSWVGLTANDVGKTTDTTVGIVMTGDRAVTVRFTPIYLFSVTMDPEGAGTLDFTDYPLKSYYVVGDTISLIADPKAGYQFVEWEGVPAGARVVGNVFNYVYGGTNRDNIELIAKFEAVESAPGLEKKLDGDLGYDPLERFLAVPLEPVRGKAGNGLENWRF